MLKQISIMMFCLFIFGCHSNNNSKIEIIDQPYLFDSLTTVDPCLLIGTWYLRKTEIRPSGKSISSTKDSLFYRGYGENELNKIQFLCGEQCVIQDDTISYNFDGYKTLQFSDSIGLYLPIIGTKFELNWKPNNRLKFHNQLEQNGQQVGRFDYLFFRDEKDTNYKHGVWY